MGLLNIPKILEDLARAANRDEDGQGFSLKAKTIIKSIGPIRKSPQLKRKKA